MGNRSSKALRINLLQPPQDIPVPIDVIRRNAEAICTICNTQDRSVNYKGVLIRVVTAGGQCIEGFITHCIANTITSCNAEIALRPADGRAAKITVETGTLFSFYCPLSEIVFIKFEQAIADNIRANNGDFIHVPLQEVERLAGNTEVFICDSTVQRNQVTINCGALKEYYGLDIRHDAVVGNDSSSAGLPVFTQTGQLIGIQKFPCLGGSSSSLAVSMANLVTTHFCTIFTSPELSACALVTNPVNITDEYEAQLRQNGLEKHEVLKLKYSKCNFFVSPREQYITPIWFMPTRLGWYWTPTDPNANDKDSNWMPVDRLAVIGGFWNGQIPAKKNVVIIRWLSHQQRN